MRASLGNLRITKERSNLVDGIHECSIDAPDLGLHRLAVDIEEAKEDAKDNGDCRKECRRHCELCLPGQVLKHKRQVPEGCLSQLFIDTVCCLFTLNPRKFSFPDNL